MKSVLIIGGCGFIGTNVTAYHLRQGDTVYVVDNLSRKGAALNQEYLKTLGDFSFFQIDIRDKNGILRIFENNRFDIVYHFAAQVAVTTSVIKPQDDLEINILGTFNILEAMRKSDSEAILIYASTNKVYGELKHIRVVSNDNRYIYENVGGIDENCQLDFYSPYGCSKGSADQYVLDYSRIYGLKTISFRQSCIYGYRQFGIEDQGWVAWFIIAAIFDKKIRIYGDGKQVRDVLFIDDLINAYVHASKYLEVTNGHAYNIGGGDFNMSLLELIEYLEALLNKPIQIEYADWRHGDQKVFVCDITKARKDFSWTPKVSPDEGVKKLVEWCIENKELFLMAGIV